MASTGTKGWQRARRWLALFALLGLAGCNKPATTPPPPAPASTPPASRPTGTTTGESWQGAPLRGNDPRALAAYLRGVQEVKARRFEVQWSPATVALDREAAIRSLRSISRDGAVFGISRDDPAAGKLAPGSILWIWNVAIRKVDSLEPRGDVLMVHTRPVALNEAMPNAHIEFDAPIDPRAYFRAKRSPATAASRRRSSNFRYASLLDPGGDPPAKPATEDEWYDEGMSGNAVTGEAQGWGFSVGYQPAANGLSLELQARKGGASEQPWEQGDEELDARIRARVDLEGFSLSESLAFTNGNIDGASSHFRDLKGKVRAQLIGRLGKPGVENIKVPVMHLPVSFDIPVPVGGIPFIVQVGTDFLITLSLSGLHATLSVDGQTAFSGDGGFDYSQSKASYSTSFNGTQPSVDDYKGISPGVSAVVLGVQMPRLGVGLGLIGASTVSYVDVINVITMTNGAAVGGLGPPCKNVTYSAVGHVGIETTVLPLPLGLSDKAGDALSAKREIFNIKREVIDPPIKMCEIK
ncbi:MAG: hypothetical protein U1F35_12515 [Steroidobacteraceae bacterium]